MPLFVVQPSDDADEPRDQPDAQHLGYAAGVRWYKGETMPMDGRPPTAEELSKANLDLPAIRQIKASTRRKIESEVGDLHEIVADQAKQIEALTVMLCRLSAEYLGGTAMTADEKSRYLARVETVLGAISTGHLTLRGDLEGTDDMLQKTLSRTNRINEIVGSEYLPKRADVFT